MLVILLMLPLLPTRPALSGPKFCVNSGLGQELGVRAGLRHSALGDDEDLVGVLNRAQAMRNRDRRSALLSLVQGFLNILK